MTIVNRFRDVAAVPAGVLCVLLLLVSAPAGVRAQADAEVRATIDVRKTSAPISKYVYGQFLEHIGGIINRGLWAEMLDDRKFFHPVAAVEPPPPPGPPWRTAPRRWTIVGPEDAVVMETEDPYVGEQAPRIRLAGSGPRGLRQAGVAVRKGRSYVGHAVLAGDSTARVTVSLVWGATEPERATVAAGPLTAVFTKVPLEFTAESDTDDARFEITGEGSGSFRVGVVSLMPADHIEGFRRDTVTALKGLRSGVYRFPGSNFVSISRRMASLPR